jgi:hypothetical protein
VAWTRKGARKEHPSQTAKDSRNARITRLSESELNDWGVRLLNDAGRALQEHDQPLFYDSARLLYEVAEEMNTR